MKLPRVNRRFRSARPGIELLEVRCLLSATFLNNVPTQTLNTAQGAQTVNLGTYFDDPTVTGTVVDLKTNLPSPNTDIPIMLTDKATPLNVANFLQYINSGEYSNTIVHRSVPGFIFQGGGYTTDGNHIQQLAPVQGEASTATLKNTVGTIAMALTGTPQSPAPNSGTSEWFINLATNSQLDDASDGGPFTAFGSVIYNGMTTVNAIAALPVVDNSATNGNWSTLPVQNYAGPSTVTPPLPAGDFVVLNPVVIPGGLTYRVTSSSPAIVAPSVSGQTLTLTPGGTAGIAKVTITAIDFGGGTESSSFSVRVGTNSPTATIGKGAAKSVTYTDPNGTIAVATLSGPGQATFNFSGTNIGQTPSNAGTTMTGTGLSIASISTTGTTRATNLTITTRRGTRSISIGSFSTDALGSIVAGGVTLTQTLSSSAAIGRIVVAGAMGGVLSAVSVGSFTATGDFSDSVSLTGGGLDIASFKSASISGGTWTVGGSVNSISTGAASNWAPVFAQGVKTIQVRGSLTHSTLRFTGAGANLTKLVVTGDINNSTVNATGSIGTVTAASLTSSTIVAGVEANLSTVILPTSPADFTTQQSILSVKLKNSPSGSISNSIIAAWTTGTLSLGTLSVSNGVAADTIKSFTATASKRFTLRKLDATSNVGALLTSLDVPSADLAINLV